MAHQNSFGGVHRPGMARFYARRAEGGVGLILSDATAVPHPVAHWDTLCSHFHGIPALEAWKHIIAQVKAAGGLMMPQLWHSGFQRPPGAMPNPYLDSASPSGMFLPAQEGPSIPRQPAERLGEPMTADEIDSVIMAYGEAAQTAQRLGFNGIEVHGAHGYLIDQFLWDVTNHRSDPYGGDSGRRARFAAEIVGECRRRVGPDFPILFRLSQWKVTDYGGRIAHTPAELAQLLEPLVDAGVDVIDTSTRRFWEPEFPDSDLNLAGWAKKLTGKPSITVGSVGTDRDLVPSELDKDATSESGSAANSAVGAESVMRLHRLMEMFDRGDFDLVAVARIILANADWPNLVRNGEFGRIAPFAPECMRETMEEG
jgi:2,4-dienoyl-CoA reductase-like NADH-dependent reductase (Old Yellow Enzyme family)